ncbi:MAG: hypothetical protein OEW39_09005 [Deltaproteobacteria bacterium]|nr:hypothetical protein [Deltaproteobacteria bacterium]
MDETLKSHRERVSALKDTSERLLALHQRLLELRNEEAALTSRQRFEQPEVEKARHDEIRSVVQQVLALREHGFGPVDEATRMRIMQAVEALERHLT